MNKNNLCNIPSCLVLSPKPELSHICPRTLAEQGKSLNSPLSCLKSLYITAQSPSPLGSPLAQGNSPVVAFTLLLSLIHLHSLDLLSFFRPMKYSPIAILWIVFFKNSHSNLLSIETSWPPVSVQCLLLSVQLSALADFPWNVYVELPNTKSFFLLPDGMKSEIELCRHILATLFSIPYERTAKRWNRM